MSFGKILIAALLMIAAPNPSLGAVPQKVAFQSNLNVIAVKADGDLSRPINAALASCSDIDGCSIEISTIKAATLSAPILITKSNVSLTCLTPYAMATTYSRTPLSSFGHFYEGAVEIDGVSNVVITGCSFDVTSIPVGLIAIHVFSSSTVTIKDNRIVSAASPAIGRALGIRVDGTFAVPSSKVSVTGNYVSVPYIAYSVGDNVQDVEFGSNRSVGSFQCFDFNGSGGQWGIAKSFSLTNNVATLTGTFQLGPLGPGTLVNVFGLASGPYLNGKHILLSASATSVTFPAPHANVEATNDNAHVQLVQADASEITFRDGQCAEDKGPSYVESARNVFITGNQFVNDSTIANGETLRIHNTLTNNPALHVVVASNNFFGSASQSSAINIFQNAADSSVYGNRIRDYGQDGILIGGSTARGNIIGNVFVNNGQLGAKGKYCGIRLLSGGGHPVLNQKFVGNQYIDTQKIPTQVYGLCATGGDTPAYISVAGEGLGVAPFFADGCAATCNLAIHTVLSGGANAPFPACNAASNGTQYFVNIDQAAVYPGPKNDPAPKVASVQCNGSTWVTN